MQSTSCSEPAYEAVRFSADAPQTAAMLEEPGRGGKNWWQEIEQRGTPLIETGSNGDVWVTFIWRDTEGCERTSPVKRVYADVNSVTDHHSFAPQSLERVSGTDIWFWQVELPKDWRGTYSFIPVGLSQCAPFFPGGVQPIQVEQRNWWQSITNQAIADPLNPLRAHKVGRYMPVSPLHLPDAPNYALWHSIDSGLVPPLDPGGLIALDWASGLQNKQRKVWVYVSGKGSGSVPAGGYPLVILLDGDNWAEQMPIQAVVEAKTASGELPPAVYVFVDSIDPYNRSQDLPCNPLFWEAVSTELLPLIAEIAPITPDPALTAVVGQSYGGLAATYAGVHLPERFGLVLAQSGSFWWPNSDALRSGNAAELHTAARNGWLTKQVATKRTPHGKLRVFMEVGRRESDMIDASDAMDDALRRAGHDVSYRRFQGGHDGICWRNGLIDGLCWLFAK